MKIFLRSAIPWLSGIILLSLFTPVLYGQALAYGHTALPAALQEKSAVRLRDILLEMQRRHDVNIVFDEKLVEGIMISPDRLSRTANVTNLLTALLEGSNLQAVKVRKNSYLIVRKENREIRSVSPQKAKVPEEESALVHLPPATGTNRTALPEISRIDITGRVVDEKGEGLPGVNILLKGTRSGTTTDANGAFELNVPDDKAVLVFSFVGYLPQEIIVGNRSVLEISLKVDQKSLEEVVVIGYGEISSKNLVSAVSNLKTEELEKIPYKTSIESMTGRIPGVFIQTDNNDGALPIISIRGGGEPLYIIDGVKQSKEFFSMIPPSDIETISILKDASASAVFGAEAGNGVVLITTKKGKQEGFLMNYFSNVSFQTRLLKPNFLSPYEFAQMANQAALRDGRPPSYTDEQLRIYQSNTDPRFIATDVFDETVNKYRSLSNHNLSLRGKSGNTAAFLSLNYQTEGSEFKVSKNQGTDRFSLRSDVSHKLDKIGLTVGGHLDAQRYDAIFPPNGSANIWTNIRTYGISPGPLVNPEGNFYQPYFIDPPLPEASDKAGYDRRQHNWINTRLTFTWDVPWIDGLDITTFGNFLFNNQDNKKWTTTSSGRAQLYTWDNEPIPAGQATLSQSKEDQTKFDFQTQINYYKTLFNNHTISLTGLYTQYEAKQNFLSAYRRDFLSSALDQLFAGSNTGLLNDGYSAEEARRGWIGRARYDYKSKYILEFSFRYDGSDNFPKEKRWGFFPAVSGGWNVADEPFMETLAQTLHLNLFKLRASWGKTGLSGGGGRFGYIPVYNYTNNNYYAGGNWVPGFSEGPLVSNDFTWYERTSYDAGIDFAFFGNKLSGSIDWFFYRTVNYLASPQNKYTTPLGKSLPVILTNSAHRRAGAEVQLNYNTRLAGVEIGIGTNIAYFDQMWEQRFDETESVLGNPYKRLTHARDYYTVGYLTDGYYQSMEEVLNNPRLMGRTMNWPGNVKYLDVNGDGKVDIDDQRRIGTSNFAHVTYGSTIDLSYKGFSVNALLQGTSNRQIYLGATWQGAIHNKPYDIQADNWSEENPNAMFPRNSYLVSDFGTISDKYLIDAWYIRLKALSIGYDLKRTVFSNLNSVSELSIILSGTNLLTASPTLDYYMDPEVEASSNHNMRQPPRVYNVGIRVGLK